MAAQYGEDELELRRILKRLVVDCGALLWQDDPRGRASEGTCSAVTVDASRARVRAQTVQPVVGSRPQDLPKRQRPRKQQVRWIG